MSKLAEILNVVIAPLKFLIDKDSKRIDMNTERIDHLESNPTSIQSDMSQCDPEAPDYIKNRIGYDITTREVIFEADVKIYEYDGTNERGYSDPFILELGVWYEVDVDEKKIVRQAVPDRNGNLHLLLFPVTSDMCIYEIYGGELQSIFRGWYSNPHVTIAKIIGEYKALPEYLANIPPATSDTNGTVRVSEIKISEGGSDPTYTALPVWMYDEDCRLYAENPLPKLAYNANGTMLVAENGKWVAKNVQMLPTVTSDDKKKVLSVNTAGIWEATSIEEKYYILTQSINTVYSGYSANFNFTELWDAIPPYTTSSAKLPRFYYVIADYMGSSMGNPVMSIHNVYCVEQKYEGEGKTKPAIVFWIDIDGRKKIIIREDNVNEIVESDVEYATVDAVQEMITSALSAIPSAEEASF